MSLEDYVSAYIERSLYMLLRLFMYNKKYVTLLTEMHFLARKCFVL